MYSGTSWKEVSYYCYWIIYRKPICQVIGNKIKVYNIKGNITDYYFSYLFEYSLFLLLFITIIVAYLYCSLTI